ncbi:SAM-dependent methyltransferase [Legionella maceachernii]|uniref:Methyltransferase n=1 Tax=Legionella maceachernii TaxID=466 RepID=A0A0W0WI21_9GAMM|nr:SAM-dependent methyltransferase [Legionella maceachernii]KTD31975.1 methyltransferase [Legionella maceachernii]SKA24194.1 23S rRNA (cytidine2498-2'-O)-methyltransferase [Legionella maceachernii]SUP04256.1 Ribosomal RNA large subunit methyltransferase M [Legionella maceachernii]
MQEKIAAVYVVKPEFLSNLCQELGQGSKVIDDLVFCPSKKIDACFAQDIWFDPQIVTFQSISAAAKILRQAGKFWYMHPIAQIRRSRLIQDQLRSCPSLERPFPVNEALPSIGCFSLLDHNTLVYSVNRWKKWPDGICHFIEDKINPPNRAYLKLWEAFTLLEKWPTTGETVLDLGASPGGWTYVAQTLGATVTAVDKAPLDEKIAKLPRVSCLQQSAFAIDPVKLDQSYDWVLSDVICYPARAYNLIMKWITSDKAKHLIFTIKFQGQVDSSVLEPFQAIPNSRIINLYYNKHEATFFYPWPHIRE